MTAAATAPLRSPRDKRVAALLGVGALGGLVVLDRALIGYDPSASFLRHVSTTENLLFSPTGASVWLNVYVMLWLYFTRRQAILRALGQPGRPAFAVPLLVLGFALAYWSYFVGAPDLLVPSLACTLLGAAFALGGAAAARAIGLPVFFLVFLLQRPGVVVNSVVYPLQMLTAATSTGLLDWLGRDVTRYSDLVVTPDGTFQVIEGCSGLRLIETLFMAALLYVDLFRRSSFQAVVLIAISPVIAMLCNTLRVITIVLSPYSDLAAVHSTQGILVLVAGVLALAGLDSLLRAYVEPHLPARLLGRTGRATSAVAPSPLPLRGLAVLAGVIGVVALGSLAIPAYRPSQTSAPLISSLPAKVGDWQVVEGPGFDDAFMGSVATTEWVRRRYERADERVDLFIATNDRRRRLASLRSPKTALLDPGVSLEARERVTAPIADTPVDRLVLSRGSRRWQAWFWRRGEGSWAGEALRAFLALDQSPWRRPDREVVVRISTPETGGPAAAARTLESFLADFDGALAALEVPIGYAPTDAGRARSLAGT